MKARIIYYLAHYRVEKLIKIQLYPYGVFSCFLKPIYAEEWRLVERTAKREFAEEIFNSLEPKTIAEK